MGILHRLIAKLSASLPAAVKLYPLGYELISFQCDGCMAEDWKEKDRGIVIDQIERMLYGSCKPVAFLVVERTDGSQFECYKGYCFPGETSMQDRTDKPEESLMGKIVYTS